MRLENIVALTGAKLLNEPSIRSFTSICHDLKSLSRGALFIAKNRDEIPAAIQGGAYGIVFDSTAQMADQEIAWLRVDDTAIALSKIIRFHLLERNITAYECDDITLKIASQITTFKAVKIIPNDIYQVFDLLWEIAPNTLILFSETFLYKNIFISFKKPSLTISSKINIVEQTLFETSFIYDDIFYERKLLSPFFIPYLEVLLQLFKIENIDFAISTFHITEHFQPVFTNNYFEEKEFGSSDKVLIFEPSFEPIPSQINFLKEQASWAKLIYIIPSNKEDSIQDMTNIFTYNTQLDIIKILKTVDFHFALIAEQDKNLLQKSFFIKQQRQLTLDL